jgi:16S rRNA (uracil1498-N3)-methyltransferase
LFVALERSWPGTPTPDQAAARLAQRGGEAALLVGPEGGFSPAEQEHLRRFDFITPISLGPFVLRAETAAAAGQALLLGMGWAEYVPPDLKRPI